MIGLVRIQASYFVAGVLMENNVCIQAAPILGWMVGQNAFRLSTYCTEKGWKVEWLG